MKRCQRIAQGPPCDADLSNETSKKTYRCFITFKIITGQQQSTRISALHRGEIISELAEDHAGIREWFQTYDPPEDGKCLPFLPIMYVKEEVGGESAKDVLIDVAVDQEWMGRRPECFLRVSKHPQPGRVSTNITPMCKDGDYLLKEGCWIITDEGGSHIVVQMRQPGNDLKRHATPRSPLPYPDEKNLPPGSPLHESCNELNRACVTVVGNSFCTDGDSKILRRLDKRSSSIHIDLNSALVGAWTLDPKQYFTDASDEMREAGMNLLSGIFPTASTPKGERMRECIAEMLSPPDFNRFFSDMLDVNRHACIAEEVYVTAVVHLRYVLVSIAAVGYANGDPENGVAHAGSGNFTERLTWLLECSAPMLKYIQKYRDTLRSCSVNESNDIFGSILLIHDFLGKILLFSDCVGPQGEYIAMQMLMGVLCNMTKRDEISQFSQDAHWLLQLKVFELLATDPAVARQARRKLLRSMSNHSPHWTSLAFNDGSSDKVNYDILVKKILRGGMCDILAPEPRSAQIPKADAFRNVLDFVSIACIVFSTEWWGGTPMNNIATECIRSRVPTLFFLNEETFACEERDELCFQLDSVWFYTVDKDAMGASANHDTLSVHFVAYCSLVSPSALPHGWSVVYRQGHLQIGVCGPVEPRVAHSEGFTTVDQMHRFVLQEFADREQHRCPFHPDLDNDGDNLSAQTTPAAIRKKDKKRQRQRTLREAKKEKEVQDAARIQTEKEAAKKAERAQKKQNAQHRRRIAAAKRKEAEKVLADKTKSPNDFLPTPTPMLTGAAGDEISDDNDIVNYLLGTPVNLDAEKKLLGNSECAMCFGTGPLKTIHTQDGVPMLFCNECTRKWSEYRAMDTEAGTNIFI